jgi:large subunit ribosomal protein L21
MYAIIETGGKQYRIEKDDIINVELLKNIDGNKVEFDQVLFFNDGEKAIVGFPNLENCKVFGEVECEVKGPKVIAFKYKKRKDSKKKIGHRQKYSKTDN